MAWTALEKISGIVRAAPMKPRMQMTVMAVGRVGVEAGADVVAGVSFIIGDWLTVLPSGLLKDERSDKKQRDGFAV